MITPDYVRTMAAYNAEMNRRIFVAAFCLSDDERRADRGAFWRSIHGTLSHLYWGDRVWLSRFGLGDRPGVPMHESDQYIADFAELWEERQRLDAQIIAWAETLEPEALEGNLVWFSGISQREMVRPRALCLIHIFNHQTHHRGQAHALLTRAGVATADTDLPWVLSG